MFKISSHPIDAAAEARALRDQQAGAYLAFEGWVRHRNDGRPVLRLEYEAYQALAEKEGARIMAEAKAKFPIVAAAGVHRIGHLALGELAVWIGVTAEHRGAAFEACRYLIDQIKARVPIWKREHYADGSSVWINGAEEARLKTLT